MSTRFVFRILLLVTAFAAIGAIACSSDDDDGQASTGSSATATATAEPTTSATGAASTGAAGNAGSALEVSLAEDGLGSYLVGPDGGTLYVFLRDAPDVSNCAGNCLEIWPPLLLEEGQSVEAGDGIDGTFGSMDTPSGTQVTFNRVPLYYFASDAAPGETKGHLVGNVWFVARPDTASTSVIGVRGTGDDALLVGPTGMTLYLFANDTAGTSNCSGQCIENWPALTVPEGLEPTAVSAADGALGTITRDDGAIQVTYNGLPLYYYVGDSLPGDTSGDGVGGVWSLARP